MTSPLPSGQPPLSDTSVQTNVLTASGGFDPTHESTELHLEDGRVLRISTELFAVEQSPAASGRTALEQGDEQTIIPLIEEQLTVGRRTVETGRVLLHKTVHEHTETLNEPLAVRTYDIERVVLNQPVDSAPSVREEGATTIYPVVEEQLILTKQLVLREEVRVTRRDTERRDTQAVTLRREHLTVERDSTS